MQAGKKSFVVGTLSGGPPDLHPLPLVLCVKLRAGPLALCSHLLPRRQMGAQQPATSGPGCLGARVSDSGVGAVRHVLVGRGCNESNMWVKGGVTPVVQHR